MLRQRMRETTEMHREARPVRFQDEQSIPADVVLINVETGKYEGEGPKDPARNRT